MGGADASEGISRPTHTETVLAQLGAWFEDYNTHAAHSALGMRSPREYRAAYAALTRLSAGVLARNSRATLRRLARVLGKT